MNSKKLINVIVGVVIAALLFALVWNSCGTDFMREKASYNVFIEQLEGIKTELDKMFPDKTDGKTADDKSGEPATSGTTSETTGEPETPTDGPTSGIADAPAEEPAAKKPSAFIAEMNIDGYNITYTLCVLTEKGAYAKHHYKTTFTRTSSSTEKIENLVLDINAKLSKNNLDAYKTKYTCTDPNAGSIWSSLISIGGFVLLFAAFMLIFRSMRGAGTNPTDFAKVNNNVVQNVKVRFSDVAGADEEKEELKEVVDFLKNPTKYNDVGAKIPKGVLLVGPPGTGKTLFAKAVAGEAGVPFFSMSGSDFVEMFVGVGASRVRNLFATAKKNKPCIIFIDEIYAVGRQRGAGLGGGNDEREQTLNQLLVLMDGFEANEGIIVIAATNRADVLDPALLRPGRFDRQITVNLPDVKGREEILKVHARNKPLSADVSFKTLARITSGFSGADLANLLNEAAILAVRNKRKVITNVDLYEGVNKVIMGPQKKSRVVTETDKKITAYHEAGHAILANLLPHCDSVQEVSIIPRGNAAGYTLTRPDSDDNHLTLNKLLDDITMTLGGRVAEELVIKDISAGASGDIQMATKRARAMVAEWGMSELVGPVSYGENTEVFLGRDYAAKASYSEKMASIIDEEVERIIKERLEVARKMLKENKNILDNMAELLVEKETIYGEEVKMLMDGKSVEEIMEFTEKADAMRKANPFAKIDTNAVLEEVKKDHEKSSVSDAEEVSPSDDGTEK